MGHSLSTNLQYSKNIGVKRLNKQPTTTPIKVEEPTVKQNEKRINHKKAKFGK
jgi:hypothetical protein